MANVRHTVQLLAVVVLLCACERTATGPTDVAAVDFRLDAPLCSSILPVEFSIDGMAVGTDTFRVNLSPSHIVSAAYTTSAGTHALGAHVIGGYVWTDTVVAMAAGSVFTMVLPFHCS